MTLVVALAAVLVAGCTPPPSGSGLEATGAGHTVASRRAAPAAPVTPSTTTTTELPVAPLVWAPCNGDLQCATLTVPLDYADPGGPTIPIAVARHPAEDPAARIGSLVIDPGGPGLSGVDDLAHQVSVLSPQLLEQFDIVTFDPRGVGRSDPITCGETPGNSGSSPGDPVPVTQSEQAARMAALSQYAAACEKASATILPHVGTVDVARDMDRLRQALGDTSLTYMGQSYGTLLGLTYASLFPTHVRAMVLDGVIDPALSFDQFTHDQADSFENLLDEFIAWCAGTSACPWRPDGDPTTALLGMLSAAGTSPVPAGGGQTVGAGELYDTLLSGLYSRGDWPELGAALAGVAAGNGAAALAMSDRYNGSGSPNLDDAEVAVDCLDHPVSRQASSYGPLAASIGASAPVFGPLLAWGEATCAVWPAPPTRTPAPVAATDAPPILVVGTTSDPATPYQWAVNVSHELSGGVLLTRDGSDHVAYFYSPCVRGYVQSYLVNEVTPPTGTVCTS